MTNIIHYAIIFIFLVLGIQIFRGRWLFLIAGFNMKSPEEKAKINQARMSKIVGLCALSIACLEFVDLFLPKENTITTSLIFLSLIITILLVNTITRIKPI